MTAVPTNTRPLPSPRDERWDDADHVARYGFHAGHPDSGRCGGCGLEIVGEPVLRGRWIYCGDACAAPLVVPVMVDADGYGWLPGDVMDGGAVAFASGSALCGKAVSRG